MIATHSTYTSFQRRSVVVPFANVENYLRNSFTLRSGDTSDNLSNLLPIFNDDSEYSIITKVPENFPERNGALVNK